MRCLLTGADGFAGSYLAGQLLADGRQVVAVVRDVRRLQRLGPIAAQLELHAADLRQRERIAEIVRDTRPDVIYHLGALSSPSEAMENPAAAYDVNVGGTVNLLEAVRLAKRECRFLYVSSSEVYGMPESTEPLTENSSVRPHNPYAASKRAAELAVLQYGRNYGIQAIVARPFQHTGPGQSSSFVCSAFARQIAAIHLGSKSPEVRVGNLDVFRDFSDVRDIVRGYRLLMERGRPGEIYQLCSGRAIAIREVLDSLIGFSGREVEVIVDPGKVRAHDAPVLRGDPSKAAAEAGWNPQYDLKATLQALLLYWEQALRHEGIGLTVQA